MLEPRLDVLILSAALDRGGSERVSVSLSAAFSKLGCGVGMLLLGARKGVLESELSQNVTCTHTKLSQARWALWEIVAHIRKTRPSFVFSTINHLSFIVALGRPLWPKQTLLVARIANVDVRGEGRGWLLRFIAKHADVLVVQSNAMAVTIKSIAPGSRPILIPNPLTLGVRSNPRSVAAVREGGVLRFVAVGRLHPIKGFDVLLEAISSINEFEWTLSIVGDGEEGAMLRAKAETLGIEQRVRFLGELKDPGVEVERADALILSSHSEGFANVVIESLSRGTPVITTPVAGISDIVESGLNGIIAKDFGSSHLADAIRLFARSKLFVDHRAVRERHDSLSVAALYLEAYGAALVARDQGKLLGSKNV